MCFDIDNRIDFISCLPVELIEELAKYLDGSDILICTRVCQQWKKLLDQDNIWRRLCNNRGWFLNKEGDINCWRNLYWINQNWCKGLYTFYKFSEEDISQNFMLQSFNTPFTDFTSLDSDGEFLMLSRRDGINIWDIASEPKIHQRISNMLFKYCSQFDIKVNKRYLIYLTGNYIQVYKKASDSKIYKRIKVLHLREGLVKDICRIEQITDIFNFDLEMDHKAEVNNNFLVVIQNDKTVFIWVLKPWGFVISIDIFEIGVKVINIQIVSNDLFLLQIKAKKFIIRAFDMKNKRWILNLHSDELDIVLEDVHPRLIIDKQLIAILYPCSANRTVLKIWSIIGQLLRTIFLPEETYMQCCLVNDIVIYRSSKNAITIWSSDNDRVLNELDIKSSFSFIEVCPGDSLLVARQEAFEIWNWKKGTLLYTITEQTHLCYVRVISSCFYATLVLDTDKKTNDIVSQIIVFYFGANILRE